MSTVTAADLMAHPVMGGDWHEWPLLVGVLIACWMSAIVATAALFSGPARPRAPRVTRRGRHQLRGGGRTDDARLTSCLKGPVWPGGSSIRPLRLGRGSDSGSAWPRLQASPWPSACRVRCWPTPSSSA